MACEKGSILLCPWKGRDLFRSETSSPQSVASPGDVCKSCLAEQLESKSGKDSMLLGALWDSGLKQWASLIGPSKNGQSLFLLTCSFLIQAPRDPGPDISHISQFCVKLVRGWKWLLVWRVLNSVLWPSLCTSAVWVSLRDYCTF